MSADDEAKMANAVEKKRSKLNYHRASTACSKQETLSFVLSASPLLGHDIESSFSVVGPTGSDLNA